MKKIKLNSKQREHLAKVFHFLGLTSVAPIILKIFQKHGMQLDGITGSNISGKFLIVLAVYAILMEVLVLFLLRNTKDEKSSGGGK